MSQPDVTDFEVCQTLINQILNSSLEKRNELYSQHQITKDEYFEISNKFEIPLRRYAKELTVKISEGITQAFTAYQGRIAQVTTKLEQVIKQIQDFQKSIDFFSKVVNFFDTVLNTASSGLAGIPNLLTSIEKIL